MIEKELEWKQLLLDLERLQERAYRLESDRESKMIGDKVASVCRVLKRELDRQAAEEAAAS